ncbi:MAG: peptide chain release factor-like protein [Deltaproteobacteria bacterium]|nr:peptide chain release factor-like protein [Deltaproteobacteria bacterium]
MSKFGVSVEKEEALLQKMNELGVLEADIDEKFIRSGGPGGQNVNKVATCVQLKHIPTGIIVKIQKDRSQGINRFLARRSLVSKIEEGLLGKSSAEQLKIEKIQKQKKRRKRRTKLKLESDINQ